MFGNWKKLGEVAMMSALIITAYATYNGGATAKATSSAIDKSPLLEDGWPPLPAMEHAVDDPKTIRTLYVFAAEHPEILRYVRCYCVCGQAFHHRSNEDCFIKSRGSKPLETIFSSHAGECMICLAVAKEAKQLYEKGLPIDAIRRQIDTDFEPRFDHHTDTEMPPSTARLE
jgi:hypothetical protein